VVYYIQKAGNSAFLHQISASNLHATVSRVQLFLHYVFFMQQAYPERRDFAHGLFPFSLSKQKKSFFTLASRGPQAGNSKAGTGN
jgi:hypothetical protein